MNKKLSPVRSNISNNVIKTNGYTGLSNLAKNDFIGKGINDSYSRSIKVAKGEKYMLVLDNLKSAGKGHTISFNYYILVNIKGVITSFVKQPLKSKIIIQDQHGKEIANTTSEALTGEYSFSVLLKDGGLYNLIFLNPSFFSASSTVNTNTLKDSSKVLKIDKGMKELKVGEVYVLNYYTRFWQSNLSSEQEASFYALDVLMRNNPTMKIEVEVNSTDEELLADQKAKKNTTEMSIFKEKDFHEKRMNDLKSQLSDMGVSTTEMKFVSINKTFKDDVKGNYNIHSPILIKVLSLN